MLLLSTQFRINIILHLLLGISNNAALQCYVCGPKATISCDNFSPSNKFVQQCPDAKSCSTQTHGNLVERSCEEIELHDCKTANDVRYCYCAKDFCNDGRPPEPPTTTTDDEDLTEEGSGTSVIRNNVIVEQKRSNTTSQSSHTYFYLFCTSIPLLAILLN